MTPGFVNDERCQQTRVPPEEAESPLRPQRFVYQRRIGINSSRTQSHSERRRTRRCVLARDTIHYHRRLQSVSLLESSPITHLSLHSWLTRPAAGWKKGSGRPAVKLQPSELRNSDIHRWKRSRQAERSSIPGFHISTKPTKTA